MENLITNKNLFISYASEDKNTFVKPLAETLRLKGLTIWYDEFEIKPGMSIRTSKTRFPFPNCAHASAFRATSYTAFSKIILTIPPPNISKKDGFTAPVPTSRKPILP